MAVVHANIFSHSSKQSHLLTRFEIMPLRRLRNFWTKSLRAMRDEVEDVQDDMAHTGIAWRLVFLLILAYFLVTIAMGIYWSLTPSLFSVKATPSVIMQQQVGTPAPGVTTTATLIRITETLWKKPGGYIYNDISPPGIWLDDMPHWEYGVIIQVRDMNKALREAFSRSQSQSLEDADLQKAESRFNFDHDSWLFPATESQYHEGAEFLRAYLTRLADDNQQDGQFFARADNLNYWLATVETRLGNLSQRLSASVGQQRLNTDLAGDAQAPSPSGARAELFVKTPWNELDDVLFETRGSAWALIHLLKAVEVDFAEVLKDKNALVSMQQIIRELEATQQTLWSPVVLNGSGFGVLANHSLVMASYISRANAAIIDLRRLLQQG